VNRAEDGVSRIPNGTSVRGSRGTAAGIRLRVLVPVNIVLAAGIAAALLFDYQRALGDQIAAMHVSLEEEAKTLLPAVRTLRAQGIAAVQSHIDLVCGRMQETTSPGHHIVVQVGETTLQARAHHRASQALADATRRAAAAPDHVGWFEGDAILVGSDSDSGMRVLIGERISEARRRVGRRGLVRGILAAVLGLIAAGVVNLLLLRTVVRPFRRLAAAVRRIGAGGFDTRVEHPGTAELDVLADEVNAMAASLQATERQRDLELDRARQIQSHLNEVVADIAGLRVARLHRPAHAVGGDYAELVRLPDGAVLLCVADVIGHGIPAALEAAILKTLLAAAVEHETDPARILGLLNERFLAVTPSSDFATAVLVRFDPTACTLEVAIAGQEPGVLLRPGCDVAPLGMGGVVLGLLADAAWRSERVTVERGTRLLVVTDGVTEARSADGTLFGRERVEDVLVATRDMALTDVVLRLEEALGVHRGGADQTDDVTAVAIELL